MSSSKRRKLDSGDAPSPPPSAISAIAARRRLTESAEASSPSTPSTPETKQAGRVSSPNAFSVLQKLSRQGDSASAIAAKEASTASRAASTRRADAGRNTPSLSKTSSLSDEAPSATVQFTSFRPSKRNYRVSSKGVTQLSLAEGERFLVLGNFGVRLIEGELTVAGATLRPSRELQFIQAPHCYAIPVLRTVLDSKIELHSDPTSHGLRHLGRLSPLMKAIWNDSANETFRILYSSDDVPDRSVIQELASLPAWNRKLSELVTAAAKQPSLRIFVCGPKSAGKSTFSRLLTNKLVTQEGKCATEVVCLDLDPGQPEYGLPGTVSLVHVTKANLSPPFTRAGYERDLFRIVRSHAIASVSPAADPDLYKSCTIDLYQTYCKELSSLPLIVNTPGWILGTGLELLAEMIVLTASDEVIYMSEEGPSETVDALRASTKNAFTTLPSQQSDLSSRTAAHFRSMQTLCYFHQQITSSGGTKSRPAWNTSPLTAVAPFQVRYDGASSGIEGIMTYHHQSPSDLLAETINGMVLAAVEIEDPRAYGPLLEAESKSLVVMRTPEGLPYISNPHHITLDPRYSRAIGLILVRGVDAQTRTLQVLTPIPLTQINGIKQAGRSIVLVHGKFDAPSWAYTEDMYSRQGEDESTEQILEAEAETSDLDDTVAVAEDSQRTNQATSFPWVEVLRGNQRRPTGSKVWRVRRDLGRKGPDG